MKHPIAYIAGPIRTDSILGWAMNLFRAWAVSRIYWRKGYAVICPHSNTAFMDRPDIGDGIFLGGDLSFIEVAELVVMMPRWKESAGAAGEREHALKWNKKIVYLGERHVVAAIVDLMDASPDGDKSFPDLVDPAPLQSN